MGLWKAQELLPSPLSLSLLAVTTRQTQSSRALGTALCPTGGRDSGSSRAADVRTANAMPAFWEACKQPAAHASIYTAWMALCCLSRIRPFGRLRNDPELPCFVFKSNPSGLDHGRLLFEISLLEELGLAPGMGDSPSLPLSHRSQPSCLSLLCFSTSRGSGGGAGASGSFCAARSWRHGCPRRTAVPPRFPWVSCGHTCTPPTHIRAARTPEPWKCHSRHGAGVTVT